MTVCGVLSYDDVSEEDLLGFSPALSSPEPAGATIPLQMKTEWVTVSHFQWWSSSDLITFSIACDPNCGIKVIMSWMCF